MSRKLFRALFALSIAAFAASAQAASVRVYDLRCEYLRDPVGVDVEKPRLSWKLFPSDPSARGQRQTGYRVLVANSKANLDRELGDLWDSGRVASDESVHVAYAGKPLSSGTECWWKVQVWDERGEASPWSEAARWVMGLLGPIDASARWIGSDQQFRKIERIPPEGDYLADPWLRKTFELPERPVRAIAYVASVGYHELYVNCQKAGDAVLSPCVSDHRQRARYVAYEIGDLLRAGRNALGLWLGTSWAIFPPYRTPDKPQTPIAIAQIDVELPGGKTVRWVTDETWRAHPSPNALLGVWMFMDYGGEYYDAAKEIPDWCSPDFDDSSWKPATAYAPRLLLSAQMVEPNRCAKHVPPAAIEETSPGRYRVDMGVNFAGFVEVDVRGKPGEVVEFLFSEAPERSVTHNLRSAYRIGPSGKGTFSNRFNYMVGRWIEIRGLSYRPAREDIRGWLVRTDYRRKGSFRCSNETLQKIYETTLWTFENLSLGGYLVDCPQRERMGYGGDGHATLETGLTNYDLGAFYTKWSEDWRDVQSKRPVWGGESQPAEAEGKDAAEEGNLPYTAPTYWGGGGPAWSGFCVTMPWEVYEHYGDRRILEANLPTIERWLAFLETKARANLLRRWGGEWDFLGDWLWPGAEGVNGDTRETLFFNNCYWVFNLETAAKIARALGRGDLAEKYSSRAEEVRRAIHAEFYVPEDRSYANGFQAYLAIALLTRIPPAECRPAVLARLEEEILVRRNGHFWAGITGGYFLVKSLIELGRSDLLFEMATKEDYPGWGDMLRRGATTFWECWEGRDLSLLHSSYLHIGAWFIEGLGGIRPDPDAPGYKRFFIEPWIAEAGGLEFVEASLESPYGPIRSSWRASGDRIALEVSVPPNTGAKLVLPAREPEAGRGPQVLDLAPGTYRFEVARSVPKPEASSAEAVEIEARDLVEICGLGDGPDAFQVFERHASRGLGAGAKLAAFEENALFTYGLLDSGEPKTSQVKGTRAPPRRARRCFALGRGALAIDDFVFAAERTPEIVWRLRASSAIEIEGRRFRTREGAVQILGETLLPLGARPQTRVAPGAGSIWSLEVTGAGARSERFLHVFWLRRDSEVESEASSDLRPGNAGALELTVRSGGRSHRIALPVDLLEAGEIGIADATGRPLLRRRLLPSGVLPHGPEGMRLLERWDSAYRGERPPGWDAGRPSAALVEAVEAGRLRPGRAIEFGCGTGTDAIYLASKGFEVTAVDIAPSAIEIARWKAPESRARVRWMVADVLALPDLGAFDVVFDRGCYHHLRRIDAAGYVAALRRVSRPGTRVLILAGSAREQGAGGPPRVSEEEIRADFSELFEIERLEETRFEGSRPGSQGALAWSILLRRKE